MINDLKTTNNLDLMFLIETWLEDNCSATVLTETAPLNFHFISVCRTVRRGGGVAALFKDVYQDQMSFICHIHNYTEYNEEWNVFSAFNPSKCTHLEQWAADCAAPGEQSWTSCRSRDSNPQPWVTSGFKSNTLSIRPTTAQCFNASKCHLVSTCLLNI